MTGTIPEFPGQESMQFVLEADLVPSTLELAGTSLLPDYLFFEVAHQIRCISALDTFAT